MPSKFDPQHKDVLLGEERRQNLDPDRLLSLLPLRPYQVVADIGCGPGYFSLPLAKYLYDGKLYAVDTQKEMLKACQERLGSFKFTNVEFAHSTEKKIPLSQGSLDGALLAFVLHEAEDRSAFLQQVASFMKKAGWVAVLEWKKEEMEEGPPLEERLDEQEVREMAEQVGLRPLSQRDVNEKQYMWLLVK